jgi:hypothetical protein
VTILKNDEWEMTLSRSWYKQSFYERTGKYEKRRYNSL